MTTDRQTEIAQPGYRFSLPEGFEEVDTATHAWFLRQFELRDVALNVSTYVRPLAFEGQLGLEAAVGAALADHAGPDISIEVVVDENDRRDVELADPTGDPTILRVVAIRVRGGVAVLELAQPLALRSGELMTRITESFQSL